ncbi:MAG: rhodanese-like domain-containing protein [Desulfosudaceae bacterium]
MTAKDDKTGRLMLIKAMWQTAGIIVVACLLAGGVNLWRDNGLRLIGDWSADSRLTDAAGESLVISLKEASRLYMENKALFLDARPEWEFDRGHIQGALSLPWQNVDERFMALSDRLLKNKKTIITYCDGETCDLSHELARFLSEMGMADVRVLVNGWSRWRQAGLPTETKEQDNE